MSRSLLRTRAIAAVRLAYAAFAIVAFSASASAAPYIFFVAANGNDANPCTVVTAPCKTLQRAVNVTPANGTVSVLTALQGHVTINKSITISGDGAPIVGTITISGASTKATLRGLELNGVGIIATGINVTSAAAVHIEDSTVERYTVDGIKMVATTPTELFVSGTVVRDNGARGLLVNDVNARVSVEDSRFESNGAYGIDVAAAGTNVIRSLASGSTQGGILLTGGTTNITETTAVNNGNSGFWLVGNAVATLASSVARGNTFGLRIDSGAATIVDGVIDNNFDKGIISYGTVTMINSLVVSIVNNGTIYTRQNNSVGGNVSGSSPVPFAAY